ncbi:ABC transporter ATP-binding protein [Marinobacter fonticola]|uniref:ABC transporter ATP-binding protein n=1 Tax=Marinobacter fonticola TaxID=2603215 RepID=UPI0011E6AD70|nr:ABC transporter ATP-binding protein [Marinobacter fonticola]
MYILNVIKNILGTLDGRTRKKYYALQFFFLFSAFFQVVGIASIGPFISILSNPAIIHENSVLSYFYELLGFSTNLQFIIAAALGSLIMILISNTVAGLTIWFTYKFSVSLGSSLQQTVYRNFLHQDYLFHKTQNYNKKIAIVSQQIPRFVYMLFQPFLLMTSQLFVAGLILVGLLILDPILAIISALLIGGSYLATYIYLRKKLKHHGEIVYERSHKIQSILSESFIGIKDVKLDSMEPKYTSEFNKINIKGLNSQAFISLSGDVPKFIIESISFGAILVLALTLLITRDNINSVVPILSIYALAGYKLLPTMQQIYKSISSLSGHGSVAGIIRKQVQAVEEDTSATEYDKSIDIETVELKDAQFTYPKADHTAVSDVSLKLQRGQIYSLVGHSGSGKSTLADIILGLLNLDSGEVLVNNSKLEKSNLAKFRKKLGYVAQNIFILEDTVTRNVAFGLPEEEVDIERVKQALCMANALEFVETLPKGLDSNLGQDGKLLSGGQRQRIGIARALYKQADLLVLDEPTSALDIESELKLMNTLNTLKQDLIILLISHRPAAIRASDEIILLEKGQIKNVGSFDDLQEMDASFGSMMSGSLENENQSV